MCQLSRSVLLSRNLLLETDSSFAACLQVNGKFVGGSIDNLALKAMIEATVQAMNLGGGHDVSAELAELKKGLGYDPSLGTAKKPAKSCRQILRHRPTAENGLYTLNLAGEVGKVYCDMESGGWTALFDARVNFWPKAITSENSAPIKRDGQWLGIHNKAATSTKRSGKGYVKLKVTVNWPKFEKMRVTYAGGEHCQMSDSSGVSTTRFKLGNCDQDWLFPQFRSSSGKVQSGSTCVASFQHIQTGHEYTNGGENVGFFACKESKNQILEMGTECGSAQCSTGGSSDEKFSIAKYVAFYVM